jgi:hypothetical protein
MRGGEGGHEGVEVGGSGGVGGGACDPVFAEGESMSGELGDGWQRVVLERRVLEHDEGVHVDGQGVTGVEIHVVPGGV